MGKGFLPWSESGCNIELTIHLNSLPRLGIREDTPRLPLYALVAEINKTFHFYLIQK